MLNMVLFACVFVIISMFNIHTQETSTSSTLRTTDGSTPSNPTELSSATNTPETSEYSTFQTTSDGAPFDLPPLSVSDVEELIGNTTIDYLDTFPNAVQRTIIYEQLKYCPYTPLCRVKLPAVLPDLHDFFYQLSCCGDCICNYKVCSDKSNTHQCCPDLIVEDGDKLTLRDNDDFSTPVCIDQYLRASDVPHGNVGISAIVKCPPNSDSHMNSNCVQQYTVGGLEFSDLVPVTDKQTGDTYRNRFCAACNHVNEVDQIAWNVVLKWTGGPLTISTEAEAIDAALSDTDVQLMYVITDNAVNAKMCDFDIVSKCNVTGNWTTYNSSIEWACLRYSVPYRAGEQLYENVFCAICNGYDPEFATCDDKFADLVNPGIQTFSVLLKSSSSINSAGSSEHLNCGPGYVEDRLKETCLKLHCLNMKWLSEGKCMMLNTFGNLDYMYVATVRVTPRGNVTILQANQMQIADRVIKRFYSDLQSLGQDVFQSGHGPSFSAVLCGAQALYIADTTGGAMADRKLLYYDVRLQMSVESFDDPDTIIDAILQLENRTMTLFYNDDVSVLTIEFVDNLPEVNFLQGNRVIIPHIRINDDMATCNPSATTVRVTHTNVRSCPVVKLSKQEYNWTATSNGIYLPGINQEVNNTEFIYADSDTVIVMCKDTFVSKVNGFLQYNNAVSGSSAEGILTIVSLCISLVCLVLAFVTFCLFRVLRTLPGKINMALILSLFVAQVMFVIAMYSGVDTESTLCVIVGLLLHLSWLLALMWMNICTFHVFRLFVLTTGAMPRDEGWKPVVLYTMYGFGMATLFVLINVVVSLVSSDMSDVGYGGAICYISSPKMIGYTFGIPVGLIVVANLCMFVTVIVQIKRAPVVDRNVKNHRNDIIVFAKLSSLTGASWLFGLLFDWTGIIVFSYFFILLNASQGLFLFLAFVCNKRVFDMYVKRVTVGQEVSYTSYGSSNRTGTTTM